AAGDAFASAGALVADDQLGPAEQRACYCHPLTLAARELRGQVPQAIGDPETLEQFGPPHPVRAPPSQEGSQIDVLLRCEVRQQIAVLEDEADAVTTDSGECAVAEAGQIGLAQQDLPRRGLVEAG